MFVSLQLRATETSTVEKNSNTTTVILTIEDMNDNSPVFSPGQTTAVNVTENEAPGVALATFKATDADSGNFGTVSYYLEDDLGKFAIQEQSVRTQDDLFILRSTYTTILTCVHSSLGQKTREKHIGRNKETFSRLSQQLRGQV